MDLAPRVLQQALMFFEVIRFDTAEPIIIFISSSFMW